MRAFSRINQSGVPGPEGSIQKIFWSELNQRFQQIAQEMLGPYGQLDEGQRPVAFDDGAVVLRLPARARQHHRSGHLGNPAQHHRPLRARPAQELSDMQFGLTETQQILKNSAREFFRGRVPHGRSAPPDGNRHGLRRGALDRRWPTQGWSGIIFPENVRRPGTRHGGAGGRDGRDGPRAGARAVSLHGLLAGAMLDAAGSAEQKRSISPPHLPRRAKATLALLEAARVGCGRQLHGCRTARSTGRSCSCPTPASPIS